MRQTLSTALLTACSIIFCIFLLEMSLRFFYFVPWSEENIVGNPDHRMTKRYHDNVNEDGIRSRVEASAYLDENFNVIFLGDSFIYGWRAKMGATIPWLFELHALAAGYPSIRTANFGWVSSSPFLQGRQLRDIGKKYHPDLVVMTIDMTDVFDDLLYQNIADKKRFFAIGQYFPATTLMLSAINQHWIKSDKISVWLFGVPRERYFILEHPLEETRIAFDNMMANVDAVNAYCRDVLGVPFAVFILPRYFQYDAKLSPHNWERDRYSTPGPYSLEPFRYFSDRGTTRGYPVISLLPDFQKTTVFPTTYDDDPHLNEDGNKVAMQAMWEHLRAFPELHFPPSAPSP